MESQIFTVLSKRFKSGRLSFGKIGATCLAKICASKVENKGVIELEKLEQPIEIDDSIEQYMLEIEKNLEGITNVFRANEKYLKMTWQKSKKNYIIILNYKYLYVMSKRKN